MATAGAVVCAAIAERRLLRFVYNGQTRLVYPCAHGRLATGNEALRAHEVIADGRGVRVGAGKLFLLRSMSAPQLTAERFASAPRGYRRGDRGMQVIHCQL
jgi:hypothetical protein